MSLSLSQLYTLQREQDLRRDDVRDLQRRVARRVHEKRAAVTAGERQATAKQAALLGARHTLSPQVFSSLLSELRLQQRAQRQEKRELQGMTAHATKLERQLQFLNHRSELLTEKQQKLIQEKQLCSRERGDEALLEQIVTARQRPPGGRGGVSGEGPMERVRPVAAPEHSRSSEPVLEVFSLERASEEGGAERAASTASESISVGADERELSEEWGSREGLSPHRGEFESRDGIREPALAGGALPIGEDQGGVPWNFEGGAGGSSTDSELEGEHGAPLSSEFYHEERKEEERDEVRAPGEAEHWCDGEHHTLSFPLALGSGEQVTVRIERRVENRLSLAVERDVAKLHTHPLLRSKLAARLQQSGFLLDEIRILPYRQGAPHE
ncbi:hypothetical protein MRY87_13185 [bacterium]|nr:hypothetical protein [bacterium]